MAAHWVSWNVEVPIGCTCCDAQTFVAEEVIASEMFEETNIYEDSNDVETEAEPDDIIIVHMDIREPLSTLK